MSLVETLMSVAILAILISGVSVAVTTGQNTWENTSTQIMFQEGIRLARGRMSGEIRASRKSQLFVDAGAGPSGSDVIRFRIPIICEPGGEYFDSDTEDVANWGAHLTWGCDNHGCMDADGSCVTRDYDMIEYRIDGDSQLLRRVLDTGGVVVQSEILAHNIVDFQADVDVLLNMVTITLDVGGTTGLNRNMTDQRSFTVLMRNGA